jgi:prophage regulatory protein
MKRPAHVASAYEDRLTRNSRRNQPAPVPMRAPCSGLGALRILRLPQVQDVVGLRRSAIYDRIQNGAFPRPIKLGRASGWVAAEIEAWLSNQIEQSRR